MCSLSRSRCSDNRCVHYFLEKGKCYVFPPFSLILPALCKIIDDEATGIMVVPFWSTQPWYPLFTSLFKQSPLVFQPTIDLLLSPSREIIHLLAHKLSLVAGILSGKRSWSRDRQKSQWVYLWIQSLQQRWNNTKDVWENR